MFYFNVPYCHTPEIYVLRTRKTSVNKLLFSIRDTVLVVGMYLESPPDKLTSSHDKGKKRVAKGRPSYNSLNKEKLVKELPENISDRKKYI